MPPREVALGSAAKVIMGTSPKGETYNSVGDGLPLLNGPTEFGQRHPGCTLFTTDSKRHCEPGDLIFRVRGSTTGRMNWADRVYSLGRGVCSIRGASSLETKFIRYALDLRLEALLKLSSGSTFPNLTGGDIAGFQIPFPENRRAIASILSAYDDLIENNTRRIKILEEMAQMIYREWFVNFRFPGHENVKMVESELGPIPEGWRLGRLEDAVVMQRGFDLPKVRRIPGDVPIIAATGLNGTHNAAKVKGPGVVTGRSGSLGTVMLVWENFWPLNTTLWAKEFRQSNPIHAYFTLKALDLKGFNSGAAVPTLNRNDIHGLPTVLPDRGTLNAFVECVVPLFTLKRNLEVKNFNLRATRDLLLPKLISGEVSVEAADEQAAELMEQTA